MLVFVAPGFGLLNVTEISGFTSPSHVNTGTPTAMLFLFFNASGEVVNFTAINVSIGGSLTYGNFSNLMVYNDTNNNRVLDLDIDTILGTSSRVNETTKNSTVTLDSTLVIAQDNNASLFIVVNLSSNAYVNLSIRSNFSINITGNESIIAQAGTINLSNSLRVADTGLINVTSLHSDVELFPKRTSGNRGSVVDTNVENQTLTIQMNVTGDDFINKTQIRMPENYTVISLLNLTKNGANKSSASDFTGAVGGRDVNISFAADETLKKGDNVTIIFHVNTSRLAQASTEVKFYLHSANITAANFTGSADMNQSGAMNITTKALIQVSSIQGVKTAALANGTDYWEFRFVINFTDNVTGLLQFKMNPWNNSNTQIMNLTNSTDGIVRNTTAKFANLRLDENNTRNMSVFTTFNITDGIYLTEANSACCTINTNYDILLRMTIPSGTAVSSSWFTLYTMLFRTER